MVFRSNQFLGKGKKSLNTTSKKWKETEFWVRNEKVKKRKDLPGIEPENWFCKQIITPTIITITKYQDVHRKIYSKIALIVCFASVQALILINRIEI